MANIDSRISGGMMMACSRVRTTENVIASGKVVHHVSNPLNNDPGQSRRPLRSTSGSACSLSRRTWTPERNGRARFAPSGPDDSMGSPWCSEGRLHHPPDIESAKARLLGLA